VPSILQSVLELKLPQSNIVDAAPRASPPAAHLLQLLLLLLLLKLLVAIIANARRKEPSVLLTTRHVAASARPNQVQRNANVDLLRPPLIAALDLGLKATGVVVGQEAAAPLDQRVEQEVVGSFVGQRKLRPRHNSHHS
jgi:hypothetical protein